MTENTLTHSFQNHYSKRIHYIPFLGFSLLGDQDVSIRERIWGGSPWKPKSLNFTLLLDITPNKKLTPPVPRSQTTYWKKKVSLIAFRQILSKILPEACIFSNTIMSYLKKLVGTKSFNLKQCPAGLFSWIIPHYRHKHIWETLAMGKNTTQQLKFTHFSTTRKKTLNKFTSAIKNVIPSSIK